MNYKLSFSLTSVNTIGEMIKTTLHSRRKYLLLLLLGFFSISCSTGPDDQDTPDQILFTIELSNINDQIKIGEDSLQILTLDFLIGETSLQDNQNDTLLLNDLTTQISHISSDDEVKGLINGSFNSDVVFDDFSFELVQAKSSDQNIDSEFVEGESDSRRYSMIIRGSYNNSTFTFKSARSFSFSFAVPNESANTGGGPLFYNLPVITNVENWFLNDDGTRLLNPENSSNSSTINNNISNSFKLND